MDYLFLVVKLKRPSILLILACLAAICAGPVWSLDKKSSAWFTIHFKYQVSDHVKDDICPGPDGQFFTCLDAEPNAVDVVKTPQETPFSPWIASLFSGKGDDPGGSGGQSDSKDSSDFTNSGNNSIGALLQRTGASDVKQLQDKMFGVVQSMLCLILLCLMTGFIIIFSRFFHDGRSEKAKLAIWGYVLSLDLGFLVLAMQGFWSQDRVLGGFAQSTTCTACSPELVMALLVGCAWYTFLRSHATASTIK
ncbi:MAG TPA: hypothetical protein V6C69_16445 [Trichormus sp.]